jgi:hydroxyacylglutathione hydrolase
MKIRETKNSYSVSGILTGRSNVFLITGNGKNILIDTGPGRMWKKLRARLKKLDIKIIDYLILTHSHYDHAGNAAKVKREFGAKVIINKEESEFLERGENILPQGTNLFTRLLVKTVSPFHISLLNYEPCRPDILTDQYFDLNNFAINIFIIHTPGHSPGSQSVIVDNEIAIVGDTMFGIFPGSVFPPFAEDEKEMINSWRKLLQTDCSQFLPSHGTANSRELLERNILKRTQK